MKVLATCITCMKKASEALLFTGTSSSVKFLPAEMDNDGIVYLTCDSGHKTAMLHRNRKHQILFESGCLALLDDYTNEAVSSFSAALERAYEFFVKVAYRKLGVCSSLLESSWKHIATQSERQFGAFVLLYPVVSFESFDLPQKIPELRNKVIHRGYIARPDEVFEYAKTVFSLIRKIVQVLSDKCPVEMWAEINEAAEVQKEAVPPGMEWTWAVRPEFDLMHDLTFESWIAELKKERQG
jgi:hypothetical protein